MNTLKLYVLPAMLVALFTLSAFDTTTPPAGSTPAVTQTDMTRDSKDAARREVENFRN